MKTKLFIEFLKAQGLICIRIVASHHHYNNPDNPLSRDVILRGAKKEIPLTHIHTNLKTLGISKDEFIQLINEKKIPHVSTIKFTNPIKKGFTVKFLKDSKEHIITLYAHDKKEAVNLFHSKNHGAKIVKIESNS